MIKKPPRYHLSNIVSKSHTSFSQQAFLGVFLTGAAIFVPRGVEQSRIFAGLSTSVQENERKDVSSHQNSIKQSYFVLINQLPRKEGGWETWSQSASTAASSGPRARYMMLITCHDKNKKDRSRLDDTSTCMIRHESGSATASSARPRHDVTG